MKKPLCLFFLLLPLLSATTYAQPRGLGLAPSPAERRIALVVGNSAYATAPLKNPVHDARDMAQTLRDLGFDVLYKENINQNEMKRAIRAFGRPPRILRDPTRCSIARVRSTCGS